jgi:Contractile injection system tube protein
MSVISSFPRLLKGAIVALDSSATQIVSTIPFQFNPETLTRTLQVAAAAESEFDRSEALRLKGAPKETLRLEVEFDTTGPLSDADQKTAAEVGIYAQLSALETLIYPQSSHVKQVMQQADRGVLEIAPLEAPMALLVWGTKRILPVRLTDFSITEEAYDVNLNPIRAKVSLSLQVLNYDHLPWQQGGSKLFLAHHQEKERLAKRGSIAYGRAGTGVGSDRILR